MRLKLNKNQIERYSRQIILKNIGVLGQKKIIQSKVLIIGMGGLGCPVAEFLTRAGVGYLGIVDSDKVDLSNIHRQSLYDIEDLDKFKVKSAQKKLNKINSKTKVKSYRIRLNNNNFSKLIKKYDYIVDGSDNFQTKFLINDFCKKSKVLAAKKKLKKINPKTNIDCYKIKLNKKNCLNIIKKYDFVIDGSDNFETKFLINDFCKKFKKFLVTGAISKFDGHIFTFNFKKMGTPCIRNFFQEEEVFENTLNCEYEGVLGTVAGIVGIFQAN